MLSSIRIVLAAVVALVSIQSLAKDTSLAPPATQNPSLFEKANARIPVIPLSAVDAITQKNASIIPMVVNAAACDSHYTDCDLLTYGNRGKVTLFEAVQKHQTVRFISGSGQKMITDVSSPKDVETFLQVGRALERMGDTCKAAILVQLGYASKNLMVMVPHVVAIATNPGCVIQ